MAVVDKTAKDDHYLRVASARGVGLSLDPKGTASRIGCNARTVKTMTWFGSYPRAACLIPLGYIGKRSATSYENDVIFSFPSFRRLFDYY